VTDMKNANSQQARPGTGLVGLACFALCVVGVGPAVIAVCAVVDKVDYVGGGVFAVASALSFGLLLNGLLRA
jgi:hypothetical protein